MDATPRTLPRRCIVNNEEARKLIGQHKWFKKELRQAADDVEDNTDHAYAAVRQIIYADQYERADHLRHWIKQFNASIEKSQRQLAEYTAELEAVEAALGGAS